MGEINYELLAQAMLKQVAAGGVALKTVPSATPTTTYGHGNGGLFSSPALEKPVFSAMQLPRAGLQSVLPLRPNNTQNPLFGIFTGVQATSGSEPSGPCDDPPVAGMAKLCTHSFVWGRMARQSRDFEIDRVGLVANRGEHLDLQFLGDPSGNGLAPTTPVGIGGNDVLRTEAGKAFFELAVSYQRDIATDLYIGNPASNTALGGRKYFWGLDMLINTGYRDAETALACPAADSIVESFGNLDIGSHGNDIVARVTSIYRRLRYISSGTGLDPVRWNLVMRWGLFMALADIWPCAYNTYRCTAGTFSATQVNSVASADLIRMRDEMMGDPYERTGQYLLIDGERVPVIIDDAIAETIIAGASFRSPIYFVPMTVLGGTPVTFMEYINYDAPNGAMEMARAMAPADVYSTSDGGRFLWHKKPPTNFCVQIVVKAETRVLLLTPHLAARLTNIQYTPLAHERGWSPSDTSYWVDGGRTDYVGYGPSYYSPVPYP